MRQLACRQFGTGIGNCCLLCLLRHCVNNHHAQGEVHEHHLQERQLGLLNHRRRVGGYRAANADALEHATQALEIIPSGLSEKVQYQIWLMMGSICFRSNDLNTSQSAYESALRLASSRLERATARLGLAELRLSEADYNDYLDGMDQAIEELGHRRPKAGRLVAIESGAAAFGPIRVYLNSASWDRGLFSRRW